jgi:hypothetical protein
VIGDYAFSACSSLKEINVATENETYKSVDGNLYTKDGRTLIQYAIGKDETAFVVPEGVEFIANAAFSLDEGLLSVEIGNDVRIINENAFCGCINLATVKLGAKVEKIGKYAFSDCMAIKTIFIPKSMISIADFAFGFGKVECVYFEGSADDWRRYIRLGVSTGLEDVNRYYFSEEQPEEEGAWWHYVDGVPTIWTAASEEENQA